MVLMVTGLSLRLSVQDASHGAGQMRPVTSGKLVGAVQIARRFLPVAAIDEIVPVRDLVVHRTSGVAIGNAAIHAARGLRARLAFRHRQQEFAPMLDALLDRFVMAVVALVFQETGDLARAAIANFVLIDSPM